MAQETKQTQAPVLCATGCGFYGNPRTNGMCSVCYKDSAPRQNSTARVGLSESDGCSVAVESSTVAVSSALSLVASSMEQSSQSTEEVDFQTVGTGVQTEPQEVFCSTTESRVASEPEQCTLGQPEVADSSVAGQEGGSPVSELGCRRGKRKLEETDPQGEEATGGNEDCKSEMAQRWMTLTSLVTTRLASTNRRPLGASPAARKWASQVLTAGVETCFAAPTGTRTSTSAALTTGPRPQRRSGRRTLWSSERKSTKSKTVELCAFQSSS